MSHERLDDNITVCCIYPTEKHVRLAKELFWSICKEMKFTFSELDSLHMIGEIAKPIDTSIKFTIKPHETKGYLGIIESKNIKKKIHILLFSKITCTEEYEQCKEWIYCKKHHDQGVKNIHEIFKLKFIEKAEQNQIIFIPNDKNPICIDSTCLTIDTIHRNKLNGIKDKQYFYCDFDENLIITQEKLIAIQIKSTKKIQFFLRKSEKPSLFHSDVHLSSTYEENSENAFYNIEFLLDNNSIPKLSCGRWFFCIRSPLFSSSCKFTISLIGNLFFLCFLFVFFIN